MRGRLCPYFSGFSPELQADLAAQAARTAIGRASAVTPFVNAAPRGSRSPADPALQLLVTGVAAGRVRLDRE